MSERVSTVPSRRRRPSLVLVASLAFATFVACTETEEPPAQTPSGADNPTDWSSQSDLMTTPAKPTRTIAAMMFDIGGGPPNATNIMSVIGGTGTSQKHMYEEISYGIQDLAPSYFGPYTLPVNNCLTIACCGPSSDQTGNGATVQSEITALGMTFNHYFWVYGAIPAGANCGTWGDEGSPNKPGVYSSYSFHQIVGYAQEIGHNFGMTHEPFMCCGGTASGNSCRNPTATLLDDTSQCLHIEYGNALSFMGNGAHHPSAYHKYQQGWIGGCNVVKAGGSTTVTLVPQELPCNGVQLVQIPAPKTRAAPAANDRQGTAPMLTDYYIEMRAPLGFDSGLGPMVLVSIGPDLPTPTKSAPYVYLLDTHITTATLNDAGLVKGETFTDPAGGLSITVNSIDATSANVTITATATGTLTCADGTAFAAPGPDATSCGPLTGGAGGAAGTTGAAGAGGRGGTGGAAGGRGGATGTGAGGRGGAGGATATGTAGTVGTGAAGTTGTGTAGATGAGTAGATGAGTAGATGAGTAGAGGTGTGTGVAGTTGSGSAGTTGTGTGTAGGSGSSGQTTASGGCSCETSGTSGTTPAGMFVSLLVVGSIARRRSRRAARG